MSSTGTLSKVFGSPTTSFGEDNRNIGMDILALPQPGEAVSIRNGRIYRVDSRRNAVKVHNFDGSPIAGDEWIHTIHSPEEIVRRWGKLRRGQPVIVWTTGLNENHSVVQVVGAIGGRYVAKESHKNELEVFAYEIFRQLVG